MDVLEEKVGHVTFATPTFMHLTRYTTTTNSSATLAHMYITIVH